MTTTAQQRPGRDREKPAVRAVPSDLDAEEAVIGCCMVSEDAVAWAVGWLRSADFYSPRWRAAHASICSLHESGRSIDALTVPDQARRDGWESLTGADMTGALANAPAPSHVERYGTIVRRHAVARSAQAICAAAVQDFYDPSHDPDNLLDEITAALSSIDSHIPTGKPDGYMTFEELLAKPAEARAPWAMPGLLRVDWRAMFVGPEGAGKTVFLRQLAVAGATGTHPFTADAMPPVRTLLVDLENPEDHLQDWVDRLSRQAGRWDRRTEGRGAVWHRPGGVDLRRRTDRGRLEEIIRDHRPDLVCLGPLYKAFRRHSSRETDEEAAGEMQEIFDDLRTRHSFALVLEHHAPKAQGGVRDLAPFGSSLWLRWGEIRMSLVPESRDFPVMRMALKPFSGSRVEHAWPNRVDRGGPNQLPWVGWWQHGIEEQI